jgi:hypothetical protein
VTRDGTEPASRCEADSARIGCSHRFVWAVVRAGLLAAGISALMLSSVASAAVTHVRQSGFGPDGTLNTSFEQASALGVDQTTGEIYVADAAAGSVGKFNASGEPIDFSGVNPSIVAGVLTGFSFSTGEPLSQLAVNSTSHDFYVLNHGDQSLKAFQSDGEPATFTAGPGNGTNEIGGFTEVCGVAVDINGDIYAEDYFNGISIYAPSGELITTVEVETDCNLAVDSQGNVYINEFLGAVSKLTPSEFPVTSTTTYTPEGVVDAGPAWGVAIDPGTDHLYVDEHTQVAEYDETGERIGSAFGSTGPEPLVASEGVALNGATGQVYVSDALGAHRVQVFGPAITLPTVVTGEASNVGPTSATLEGTVNPEEVELADCRFEYVAEAAYEPSATNPYAAGNAVSCAESVGEIGAGNTPVEVHADVTTLAAGTTYHFRLVATNANGTEVGSDATLQTPPPPSISSAEVANLSASSVDLVAKINPHGFSTDYHFEYGTTAAYGASVPIPDASVGEGVIDVTVAQHVTGLSPNTIYHWRVVASNVNGVTVGSDHVFNYDQSGSGILPDGRAYEMVTPVQKNAALIGDVTFGVPPEVAEDGSRLILGADQCFADSRSCVGIRVSTGVPFSFTREGGGWVAHALSPSATEFAVNTWSLFNADLDTGLFTAPTPPGGEDHFYKRAPGGTFTDIGPVVPSLSFHLFQSVMTGSRAGTADLSHLVLSSNVPIWPFDSSESGTVYEYSGFGNPTPSLVGVRGGQGSTELISQCATQLGTASSSLPYGELSGDGHTIFFTALHQHSDGTACPEEASPPPVDELFARIDNDNSAARTVSISQPSASPSTPDNRCTTAACKENTTNPARFRDAQFVGAAGNGSRVFFTSTQQLTDDASEDLTTTDTATAQGCSETTGANGCNLYLFDNIQRTPLDGNNLVDVSAGAVSGGARVRGVLTYSSDGSHIYFVAEGVLTSVANSEGAVAQDGSENLYVYERDAAHPQGHVAFIASLDPADISEWREVVGVPDVTPDGRYLVFFSSARITSDATRTDGARQIFRYDAVTGDLIRISIGENGFNDNGNAGRGNASFVPGTNGFTRLGVARTDPTMSHDGAYVFFMSSVALTPGALESLRVGTDAKGQPAYAQNVYEYHDGHVSLISDGRDAAAEPAELCEGLSAVCLIGTDATGANVFFSSSEQLVPQDTDTQLDFYDARVCTSSDPCVAPPPAALPPCLGEACHGTPPASPPRPTPGSATFSGAGNLTPVTSRPSARPPTRAQKLAKALKACRAKHNKHKRRACEKSARKRYGAKSSKAARSKSKRPGDKRRTK